MDTPNIIDPIVDCMTGLEAYRLMIDVMYEDKNYTLARGYVLQMFTRGLLSRKPLTATDIKNHYNTFIHQHYHPLEFINLFI
jgi:hypothetical protein